MGDGPVCPVCGEPGRRPWLVASEPFGGAPYAVLRCAGCGLGVTAGVATPDEVLSWYDYGSLDAGRRFGLLAGLVRRLRRRRVELVAGLFAAPGRALDAGCGDGSFLAGLAARGWTVAGTELDAAVAATARERLGERVHVGPLEEIAAGLPAAELDLVTLWHVLEHLPRPDASLAAVRRLLRPGGLLVVEVPHRGSWQARLGGARWLHLDVPRHRHHFETSSLERLAERAGFETVRLATPFSLDLGAYPLLQTALARLGLGAFLFTDVLRPGRPGWWRRPLGLLHLVLLPAIAILAVVAVVLEAIAAAAGSGGVVRGVFRRPL